MIRVTDGLARVIVIAGPENSPFTQWQEVLTEPEVANLIAALVKAKAAAWPKPKRAVESLCPASAELLSYLRKHSNITPIKAREELGIEHLPRRVKDLKECGFTIKTSLKRGYGGKRYARYELQSEDHHEPG